MSIPVDTGARSTSRAGGTARLVGLDGLRAFAIGLVLVDHMWRGHFEGGGIGVTIFFVLSGYLITSLLMKEAMLEGRIRLRDFYLRRALRLWPALIAMLLGTTLLGASLKSALVAGTYLTDVANMNGHLVTPYGQTWSLAVEEQFYLVWPLCLVLLLAISGRARNLILMAAIVFSIAGCGVWTVVTLKESGAIGPEIFSPFLQGHGLLIGCLLALTRVVWRPRRMGTVVGVLTMAQLVIAVLGSVLVREHLALLWNVLSEVLAVSMILCLVTLNTGMYALRPVVWMGRRSYAIYLWHLPLITILTLNGWWHAAPLGVALSLLLAEISGRFVEEPFLRLRERLGSSVRDKQPQARHDLRVRDAV